MQVCWGRCTCMCISGRTGGSRVDAVAGVAGQVGCELLAACEECHHVRVARREFLHTGARRKRLVIILRQT